MLEAEGVESTTISRSQGPVMRQPVGADRWFSPTRGSSAWLRRKFEEGKGWKPLTSRLLPGEHGQHYSRGAREYVRCHTFGTIVFDRNFGSRHAPLAAYGKTWMTWSFVVI